MIFSSIWIRGLSRDPSYLPVPNVAAAALLANLKFLAAVEAGGADATCLADYQQVCLML